MPNSRDASLLNDASLFLCSTGAPVRSGNQVGALTVGIGIGAIGCGYAVGQGAEAIDAIGAIIARISIGIGTDVRVQRRRIRAIIDTVVVIIRVEVVAYPIGVRVARGIVPVAQGARIAQAIGVRIRPITCWHVVAISPAVSATNSFAIEVSMLHGCPVCAR